LVDILKLGWVKILNFKFSGDADVLLMLSQDSEDEIRSRFVFELAIYLWKDELNPWVRCAFGNVFPFLPEIFRHTGLFKN